ncbi:MAG: PIN domain-containing protein [Candidatus Limnocylindrales bacterium]
MELVDTSALILATRDTVVGGWLRDAVLANQVVICDQVALEYLRGARSRVEFDRFDAVLRAFPQVPIEPVDWERARAVFRDLAAISSGYQRSVPIADALIAATAERHDLTVAHFDGDFDRIVAVTGQVTRWVAPRPS